MKKAGLIVAGIVLAGAAAIAQTPVYSQNTVGYQKLNVVSGANLVALNWNLIGGAANVAIQNLFGSTNLTMGASLDTADDIYAWDPTVGAYKMYYLWTDGQWYEFMNDNNPTTNVVARGQGLWLIHRGATPASAVIVGEVPTEATNIVHFGVGLAQFGSAYTAPLSLNGPNVTWASNSGASLDTADDIYVWDATLGAYKMYYRWTDNQWYEFMNDNAPTTDQIPMGNGAWYQNRGPLPAQLAESKPY